MGLLFIMMLIVCEKSFCLKNEGLMQLMQIASIHTLVMHTVSNADSPSEDHILVMNVRRRPLRPTLLYKTGSRYAHEASMICCKVGSMGLLVFTRHPRPRQRL